MLQPLSPFDPALFLASFGCGLSALLAFLIMRDIPRSWATNLFLLLLGIAAIHLTHPWLPNSLHRYSFIIQSMAPAIFWMFCRITFAEQKTFHYIIWSSAFYSFLAPLVFLLIGEPSPLYLLLKGIPQWLEYLLVMAGLWEIISNWNSDLIEARRRLRGGIMLGIGLAVGWSIVSFNLKIGGAISRYLAIDLAIFILAWLLLHSRIELWSIQEKKPTENVNATHLPITCAAPQPVTTKSTTQNQHTDADLEQLLQLMEARFYRQENLTLARLAQQLDMPEYRLRATINQVLSYNNFNEYINALRINEATERLINEPETPVTNIALDVGYRTMSSFNRAFRKVHNNTPSSYRETHALKPTTNTK